MILFGNHYTMKPWQRKAGKKERCAAAPLSLWKKDSDISGLTRPRLYAVGRVDSSSIFLNFFKNKAEERIFVIKEFCAGALPLATPAAFCKKLHQKLLYPGKGKRTKKRGAPPHLCLLVPWMGQFLQLLLPLPHPPGLDQRLGQHPHGATGPKPQQKPKPPHSLSSFPKGSLVIGMQGRGKV